MKHQFKTPDIHAVKPGTLIKFIDGPGGFSYQGRAYGLRKNARFGDSLRVKLDDFTFTTVSTFSTVGIGAYYFGN